MQKPVRTIARHAVMIVIVLAIAGCKKKVEGSMEDDFDVGPMLMFRMMGMGMAIIIPILVVSLFVPAILYAIARSRAKGEPIPDRQLGLKFALGYFQVTSFQLLLSGGFILLYSLMSTMPSDFKEYIYRPAFGVIVPSAIIYGAHTYALMRTNQKEFPMVGRLWAGYNLIVTGLVGALAMVAFFVVMFQKGETGDLGRTVGSMSLVYTTTWAVLAVQFMRRTIAEPMAPAPPAPPQHGQPLPPPMHQPLSG